MKWENYEDSLSRKIYFGYFYYYDLFPTYKRLTFARNILRLHTGNTRKTVTNIQCKVLRAFSFVVSTYNKLLFIVRNINNSK